MIDLISKPQIKMIKTLAGKFGVDLEPMVIGFSDSRTTKVSELTKREAMQLTQELKKMEPNYANADRMRKKLLAMAYTYYRVPNNASRKLRDEAKAGLNAWVAKYGYGHEQGLKTIDDYAYEALPKLISQYEAVIKSDLKKA